MRRCLHSLYFVMRSGTKYLVQNGYPSVYDCHTLEGKKAGKTKADFMREEEAGLQYKQLSFFDMEGIKANFNYA